MNLKRGYDETLKNIPTVSENWLRIDWKCMKINQIYCKINRNQLEIIVKATYGLHSTKYFKILNLTFWGKDLVTRRFGLRSNSRGGDEIKCLPTSTNFCNRNTDLLLLFSIISPCSYIVICFSCNYLIVDGKRSFIN